MGVFGMLAGPRITFAPENDQGSEPDDLDEDFSLDEPVDDPVDDPDPDDLDDIVDDQDDADPEPPRQSRAENRVAKATREAKEAKEATARLERELAEIRQTRQAPQQPQETAEQRQLRLSNMDPGERAEYLVRESDHRTQQALQRMEFQSADRSDQLAYDSLCLRSSVAQKLKDEVETKLAEMRRGGNTAPRETILKYLIGERALQNAGRATSRARKTADRNVDRQTARPPAGGRGDAAPDNRRSSGEKVSRDKRVENYQL